MIATLTNTATEFGQAIAATALLGDLYFLSNAHPLGERGFRNSKTLWSALEKGGCLAKGAKYASASETIHAMLKGEKNWTTEELERMALLYGVQLWDDASVPTRECLRRLTPIEVPGPDQPEPEDVEDVEGWGVIASASSPTFRVRSNCSTHTREREGRRGWYANRRGAIASYSTQSLALKAVMASRAEASRRSQNDLWAEYVVARGLEAC
jgi:hypothetical protein